MAKEKEDSGIDVQHKLDKAEQYIQDNKKSLTIIGVVALVVIGGYFGYNYFIVKPQQESAEKQMFMAEMYFKNDSIDKAIKGDGNFPGFEEIVDNYGSSKAGNLAHYYLGVCYLKKGEYEKAIESLSKYDAQDDVTGALAFGCIGDAHLELGQRDDAIKFYGKAIDFDNNQFTVPIYMMKKALVLELNNDWKGASEIYDKIKKDFPSSSEAREVGTYLARAKAMADK
jgi:tetratricopeptide (TPR) repeat protein